MLCARTLRLTPLRRFISNLPANPPSKPSSNSSKTVTSPSVCSASSQVNPRQLSTSSRNDGEMHAPLDHVTGIQKRELLAHLAGDCDPFRVMMIKRGPGTYCQPNLMPSAFNQRLIGCVCDDHVMHIEYMWLHMGEPKRCGCGYWFELCPTAPL